MTATTKLFGFGLAAMVAAMIAVSITRNPDSAAANVPAPTKATPVKTPSFMQPDHDGNLGDPPPLIAYSDEQMKVIGSLYRGDLDGPKRFQAHCGNADLSYVRSTGVWAGATTLMYNSTENRSGLRDDVSVLIAKRGDLPSEVGNIYSEGDRDDSHYALKVFLWTGGIQKVSLDPGRAVVLLGCRP